MKQVPVFYINLDHRRDRREEFEREIAKINPITEVVERIPGVYIRENGALGCAASHINALARFITCFSSSTAIIFEDDFEFTVNHEAAISTIAVALDQIDQMSAIQITYNRAYALKCEYPNLVRILKSTTTSAYIISRDFAYKLIVAYLESHKALRMLSGLQPAQLVSDLAAIDVMWNSLQLNEKFYGLERTIGRQRKSFSDVVGKVLDYGV